MFAALCGALATAVVESPFELFRHQSQAGIISNNFIAEMSVAMKAGGLKALYWGFLPFCYESLPYDITELGTFSYLNDAYLAAHNHPALQQHLDRLAPHAIDMCIGAFSGAAAVLVSMPFDVVKTYMQIHSGATASTTLVQQTAGFFGTGFAMVRKRGPGALFVGVVPRLIQQIPSSTVCWWSIESCRKALEPYTAKVQ